MQSHVAGNPKDRHGAHDYDLARFGLTRERVLERLTNYVERFEVSEPGAEE